MTKLGTTVLHIVLGVAMPGTVSSGPMPELKTGDIVFQTTTGLQSNAIMFASRSIYTHMGMIEVDAKGKPLVIEAVGPVRTIPFDRWIKKGVGERVTVKRMTSLSENDAKTAARQAKTYEGRPYDIYFYESRDEIYCSELVYAAFKEGPNITLGKEEKVADLNIDNGAARSLIKQRWRKHPACQTKSAKRFEACYEIILNQTLVTPASIARDPKLETVFSNFGPGAE